MMMCSGAARTGRVAIVVVSLAVIGLHGGSTSAGGGEPQAPCPGGVSTGVFHTYSVCNRARNIWQVVTDEYYTCPDRSVRPVRVHTLDTTQPCDPKQGGVPPPTGIQVIRDLGPGDRFAEPAGHFIQMECISGIWHRAYYLRHRMPDGTFRISRPAARLESTQTPCDEPRPPLLPGLSPDAQPPAQPAGDPAGPRVIRVPGAPALGAGRARIELRLPPASTQQSQAPSKKTLIGVVLPETAVATAGTAQITGTVTAEPEKYKDVPGLRVEPLGEVLLPQDASGRASLEQVVVDTGQGQPHSAQEPFVLTLPEVQPGDRAALTVPVSVLAPADASGQAVRNSEISFKEITTAQPRTTAAPAEEYAAPSVCETGRVAQITGPFDGNGSSTAVAFDGQPAHVIAESGNATFVESPPDLPAGMHTVTVSERTPRGAVEFQLPVATMSLGMAADRTNLTRGERTDFTVSVNGPEALPGGAWQNGTIELRIVRESQNIRMNGEKDGAIVRQLRQRDFARGPFVYKGRIQSLSAGGFRITGILTPRLDPVKGRRLQR